MDKQGGRVTLPKIRDTYDRGQFEECLALCPRFGPADAQEVVELALLQARCLISLGRGAQAIDVLSSRRVGSDLNDYELLRRTLVAAAYLSLNQDDRALTAVQSAYDERTEADPIVQAEISVYLGIAHYRKGELQRAERLLEAVPPDADIVYAHALLYRGYAAWRRGNFAGSVDRFRDALRCVDACKRRDRFVEARCIHALAFLCADLLLLHLWGEISERIRRFDWQASGVSRWRYYIAIAGSFVSEILGDLEASTRWAELAEEIAPDPLLQIQAWCRMAARFGRNGESGAHDHFARKALGKYNDLAAANDVRIARFPALALDIADEILETREPRAATPLLTYFREVALPTMRGSSDDRNNLANYSMCIGRYEEQRGNRARAEEAYLQAFQTNKATGLRRRATIAAYRLLVLTGDIQYEAFIAEALSAASERYWLKAKLTRTRTEAHLSKRHLAILPLVAMGMTNKEIGAVRGRSELTARNTVREAIAILGVRNRAELVSVAAQRGLLKPAN